MSANFLGTRHAPRKRNRAWPAGAVDPESTADLREEQTLDLAPPTEDVPPPVTSSTSLPAESFPDAPTAAESREPVAVGSHLSRPQPASVPATLAIPAPIPVSASLPAAPAVSREPTEPSVIETAADGVSAQSIVERSARDAAPMPDPASESAPVSIAPPLPGPGSILCDRFLLEQSIGTGGTARVYRARDMLSGTSTTPNREVAIKLPRARYADPARAAARLKHEFDHASRLSHPNIVAVLELLEDQHCSFLVMELIEGQLLSTLMRDWTMLSPALTRKILRGCAQALAYAHSQSVVHGDFKPGNVFVTPHEQVKVLDFGAAAMTSTGNESRIRAGTPTYASPQVLEGRTPEPRDDVFSFACVAYELLTGQHPFERRSSLEAREAQIVPPRAWSLSAQQWLALLSALSWEREQRPAGIERLMDALIGEPQEADAAPAETAAAPAPLAPELMPRQGSWGFYAFIACTLAAIYLASRHPITRPPSTAGTTAIQTPAAIVGEATARPSHADDARKLLTGAAVAGGAVADPLADASAADVPAVPAAIAPARTPTPAAALSAISFGAETIVTSESAIAAVFLVKRSQPLTGRVFVQWKAHSGTADAGIDFTSESGGKISFADGQAQRALYIPLRNDLIKEDDETFSVQLHSPQGARLGTPARAQATILDDD